MPLLGALNYDVMLQLELLCKHERHSPKASYVHFFFDSQDHLDCGKYSRMNPQMLARLDLDVSNQGLFYSA